MWGGTKKKSKAQRKKVVARCSKGTISKLYGAGGCEHAVGTDLPEASRGVAEQNITKPSPPKEIGGLHTVRPGDEWREEENIQREQNNIPL